MQSVKGGARKAAGDFQQRNLEAARAILSRPDLYAGLMAEWAALVMAKAEPTIRGPLFKNFAA